MRTGVKASPVNAVFLQHTNSCRPQGLGAAWPMSTSTGHIPQRWRWTPLGDPGNQQDSLQDLLNSLLTASLCRERTCNCQKGKTNHCLYIWSCHTSNMELKTVLPGCIFGCFSSKQDTQLAQGAQSEFLSEAVIL